MIIMVGVSSAIKSKMAIQFPTLRSFYSLLILRWFHYSLATVLILALVDHFSAALSVAGPSPDSRPGSPLTRGDSTLNCSRRKRQLGNDSVSLGYYWNRSAVRLTILIAVNSSPTMDAPADVCRYRAPSAAYRSCCRSEKSHWRRLALRRSGSRSPANCYRRSCSSESSIRQSTTSPG